MDESPSTIGWIGNRSAPCAFAGGMDHHRRALRRTSRMEFIGVDLAWGEGSDRKAANESGVVVLDATGRSWMPIGLAASRRRSLGWRGMHLTMRFSSWTLRWSCTTRVDNDSARSRLTSVTGARKCPPIRPTSARSGWEAWRCANDWKHSAGATQTDARGLRAPAGI